MHCVLDGFGSSRKASEALENAMRSLIFGSTPEVNQVVEDPMELWIGPIYVYDIPEEKVDEFIKNSEARTPWLKYFSGESKSGEKGLVGMYYIVKREDASFSRSRM